ncbi:MAG: phospholipid-binding protein MlaC [bacterium]
MSHHRNIIALVVALFATQMSARVHIGDSPLDIIRNRNKAVEEIIASANDQVEGATREKLKDLINSFMDFEELSKRALGKYWNERTEKEKRDFVDVFQRLIKNSSVKKLEIYKADRMVYEAPKINGTMATVTTVAYKKRKQVEIVYKMHKVNDEWKAYDMEIDGVSTVRNYRDSFYKQIKKGSYKEMYDKLVKRLEKEEG